jgi:hypothetical protein
MFDGWKVVVDEEIGRKEGSWIEIAQHLPQGMHWASLRKE